MTTDTEGKKRKRSLSKPALSKQISKTETQVQKVRTSLKALEEKLEKLQAQTAAPEKEAEEESE
jgi:uncharacterized coiled-coil protein SlyX